MTNEQAVVLMIKGTIAELPKEQQDAINSMAQRILNEVREAGPTGGLALALVGAELLLEASRE